ncbi:MAG: hypothetical protein Q8O67_05075 [Deltaproteobacteria bacterium]|nr:hypothetical protein [Deltaproteobacteria bacterium]
MLEARRWVVVVVVVFGVGCWYDFTPQGSAFITCANDDECPLPLVCRDDLCLDVDLVDETAPGIDADSVIVTPAIAGLGVEVQVRFRANESLSAIPEVTLRTLAMAGGAVDDEFVFSTAVPDNLPEGSNEVSTRLVDLAGNAADVSLGFVTVDVTPPRGEGNDEEPALVGSTFDYTHSADEALSAGRCNLRDPFGGQPQIVAAGVVDDVRLHCVATGGSGTYQFDVVMVDVAGNERVELAVGTMTFF